MSAPLTAQEAVNLSAVDGVFFSRYFFPKTSRQAPAKFHHLVWEILDNPKERYAVFMIFRGASKTTLCRLFTAKRIAYGLSRTIIYVGKSQDHAINSIKWLKKQVESNVLFATTFGLQKGSKWTDEQIEIVSTVLGHTVTVLAFGITGSVRGVNIDDYRPDLIVGDDLCDGENAKTFEQREKIKDLWFADLGQSLTPATENPDAKMVLLGTMLDPEDLTSTCIKDPGWRHLTIPVIDADGNSAWPERLPLEEIQKDRDQHTRLNKSSLWMREMMCVWQAPEDALFKPEWFVKRWRILPAPLHLYLGGDTAATKGSGDWTSFCVIGVDWEGNLYVVDWWRGKAAPHEWMEKFCDLVAKYEPLVAFGETGQLRNATEGVLRKRMNERGTHVRLEWLPSIGNKVNRARGLMSLASAGKIWFPIQAPWLSEVLSNILGFPSRTVPDDDVDAFSVIARGLEKVRIPRPRKKSGGNVVHGNFGSPQGWMV